MGSPCHLTIYAQHASEAEAARMAAMKEVNRIEARYSRYDPESLLSRLNREAHQAEGFLADSEMLGLLDYAKTCFIQSDGLFDITSGVLRNAWTFQKGQGIPDQKSIDRLLTSIGFEKILIEESRVFFSKPRMEIDLGGIAKEYAADCAASILKSMGVGHGVINLGGDLRIIGPHPDGKPWEIGIHHPRLHETVMATLDLADGAVTTSGDYERAIIIEGKRYSHLLDPRTGWPVQGLQSVSVVAPIALIAGSASTIGMLKGFTGPSWLKELGLPSIWVDETGEVTQGNISGHVKS